MTDRAAFDARHAGWFEPSDNSPLAPLKLLGRSLTAQNAAAARRLGGGSGSAGTDSQGNAYPSNHSLSRSSI